MVTVKKITDEALMQEACEFTMRNEQGSSLSLEKVYQCEHSPMRTQLFIVRMIDIPTFVSVHFVRHSIGITHYVGSNRDDRGGTEADRYTPVDHMMLCNAESLINMARKRLCFKAHADTMKTMIEIRDAVDIVDPALAGAMIPECMRRKGCHELKSCGWYKEGV